MSISSSHTQLAVSVLIVAQWQEVADQLEILKPQPLARSPTW